MAFILSASFRGVPFEIELAGDRHGRDSVVHNFVKRDKPYVEDMGLGPRTVDITGFVSGENWKNRRDALVRAFNEPGPGILVHPWYGEITVCLSGPAKFQYLGGQSGKIGFAVSFVEVDGEEVSPSVSPHLQGLASSQAAECMRLAAGGLDTAFRIAGQASAVVGNVVAAVQEVSSVVKRIQRGDILGAGRWFASGLGLDAAGLGSLINQGLGLSDFLDPMFTSWDQNQTKTTGQATTTAKSQSKSKTNGQEMLVAKTFIKIASNAPDEPGPTSPGTVSLRSWEARRAIGNYQREAGTIQALKAASFAVPATRREEAVLRDALFESVDDCLLKTTNDQLSGELIDLRAIALASLAKNGSSAPELLTVKEATTMPSLVFAYRQVVRESKSPANLLIAEADILQRNRITHPGFVPGGEEMEVLRHG